MRMWCVPPSTMCRQHLLGEHVELHMMVGSLNKGTNMKGYYERGLIDTTKIISRHTELVEEMTRRGMDHKSPLLPFVDPRRGFVDPKAGALLALRCETCRKLVESGRGMI